MANWSYSQLALYKKCPLEFYWTRVDPQPAALARDNRRAFIGWLLGELITKFYVEQWWREPATVQARMVRELPVLSVEITAREKLVWRPGEREEWLQKAVDTVPKILDVIVRERLLGPTVGIEYGITVPLGSLGPEPDDVHGRVDLVIVRADGSVVLLDAKAGGTIGRFVSRDQLRLYACGLLADPKFRRLPTQVGFWWLRHGKIVWLKFDRETLLKFVHGMVATIARVRAKYFEPEPGSHCHYCDFRAQCAAGQAFIWKDSLSGGHVSADNGGRADLSSP